MIAATVVLPKTPALGAEPFGKKLGSLGKAQPRWGGANQGGK